MTHIATLAGLGDVRNDLVGALAVILGRDRAERYVTDFENHIRAQAKEGAEQAIPEISATVRQEAESVVRRRVVPLVVVSGALGAIGTILALKALRRSR